MKYLKLFEAFTFPSNRQSETIKTIKEVFADVEDIYPQITINVKQEVNKFILNMFISEVLKKHEIKSFYKEVIEQKLTYLSDNNIIPLKLNQILNVGGTILGMGRIEYINYIGYMEYDIKSDRTVFSISFKGF